MHPNNAYRSDDRTLHEALIDGIGFGMVFAATSEGPRVAHTPIVLTRMEDAGTTVKFHLARANALAPHLEGTTALVTINGPDAYVSPRWYADRATVPTWDYIALELEGPVRATTTPELEALLETIGEREELRIGKRDRWTRADTPHHVWDRLIRGIAGFEIEVRALRPTIKLHQKHSAEDRERIADALEARGSAAIAGMLRTLVR